MQVRERVSLRNRMAFIVAASFFVIATLVLPRPLRAATITVTTTDDDLTTNGNCTLREAIKSSNTKTAVDACTAGDGYDAVMLDNGTYTITIAGASEDANETGDYDILPNLELDIIGKGADKTFIDGNGATTSDRVFDVKSSSTLGLGSLTVQNGQETNGGGIANAGTLIVVSVEVKNNTASGSGGGIYNAASSETTLNNTLVDNNLSSLGGGASNLGTLTIITATFTGNNATTSGGAIFSNGTTYAANMTASNNTTLGHGGGIDIETATTTTLNNATIAYNIAGSAGGVRIESGATLEISNTIVALNTDAGPGPDCQGTMTTKGYNIIKSVVGCAGTGSNDITGEDPKIDALALNSGTLITTHKLQTSSPALDGGNPASVRGIIPGATNDGSCEVYDARDVQRPQAGTLGTTPKCDIGAYELDVTPPTISVTTPVPAYTRSQTPSIIVSVSEDGTIAMSGDCSASNATVYAGSNTVTFATLSEGPHSNCSVTVTDLVGNVGNTATVAAFTIDVTPATVTITTALPATTSNPSIVFNANESGSATATGDCSATAASVTANTATTLALTTTEGVHTNCALQFTDPAGNATSVALGTFTYDITAPRIALLGQPRMLLTVGKTFTDPGVFALDAMDTEIASRVTTTGTVNMTRAGLYVLSYNTTDATGNKATSVDRKVVVQPTIASIGLKKGVYSGKNLKGKAMKITPFSKGTKNIFGRKITFDTVKGPAYLFISTAPGKEYRIRLYDPNGKEWKNLYHSKGKRVAKLAISKSFSRTGINLGIIYDQANQNVLLAITAKSGSDTPKAYRINYASGVVRAYETGVTGKTKKAKGNVLQRFVQLDSYNMSLVTVVQKQSKTFKVWNFTKSNSLSYAKSENIKRFQLSGKTIKYSPPTISKIALSPHTDGTMSVSWSTDVSSNSTITWGLGSSYGSMNTVAGYSKTHAVTLTVSPNTIYHYTLKSCVKGRAAAIGCTTTPDSTFKSL